MGQEPGGPEGRTGPTSHPDPSFSTRLVALSSLRPEWG